MNTYWGNTGTHQALADALQKLVPASGGLDKPRSKNKELERFRRAANAYYDIFNNGGMNRAPLIRSIFGISVSSYRRWDRQIDWNRIHVVIEPILDGIILAAAKEQGIEQ